MQDKETITLIEGETRLRAEIVHALADGGFHVEPFETGEELVGKWPDTGFMLVDAAQCSIAGLLELMGRDGAWLPVIAFGESFGPQQIVDVVLEGAVEFVPLPLTAQGLDHTLMRARQRIQTVGSVQMRQVIARNRIEKLSAREREVLEGVAGGLSNRLIAERLAISPRTVEIHRANMLTKLGASHSAEAIRLAIEAGVPD